MNKVFIRGNRNGYDTEQCGETMTIRELIDYLSEFDENSKIYLNNDNGYTYGSINQTDIWNDDEYEDEDE